MSDSYDPLAGPFMTARQLTDYSDYPGYAIRWPDSSNDEEGEEAA